MTKRLLFIICFVFFGTVPTYGQSMPSDEVDRVGLEIIPQENVFVHFNTSLLFPAEYLYYSVYCLDLNQRFSTISKIAYVELIGEDRKPVFRHKVRLENGRGQGDFFVPVSVPSGNYKLIAYTNWMKNVGKDYFFRQDISVINPYRENQTAILKEAEVQSDSLFDTLEVKKPSIQKTVIPSKRSVGPVQLSLPKNDFGKREKATFMLHGKTAGETVSGNYSVSVRKLGELPKHQSEHSNDFGGVYPDSDLNDKSIGKDSIYLPEIRGELLSGSIVPLEENSSIAYKKVAISLPGENYLFKIVRTDAEGRFYIIIDADYSNDGAIVQVVGEERSKYGVKLNEHSSVDYSKIGFKKIKIDKNAEESILNRSVHNQIESAYFRFRPDSILPAPRIFPFDRSNTKLYDMADYTSFKTVREVLLEIVKDAWVRRNDGREEIEVKSMELISNLELLPLLLVDGVIEQDHVKLLDFDATKIGSIQVIRDRYIFGPQIYQGVFIVETKNGDYPLDQTQHLLDILKPEERKNYFVQNYEADAPLKDIQLPDDRLQLLWLPNINLDEHSLELDFFTSDVTGDFEICIEGFTSGGKPVSLRDYITVK